ncbi:MAG: thioredoxin domain-containing protein, partial [Gammaproteobacteria bacterium]|nr:thioredoxin domain-containing protein [Gammaproteobacteria bacterium]NIV73411.1 thioredoxin domain-containing protein [Gammaproteobacteria bacterium]
MMLALDFHQSSPRQIIVAGDAEGADTRALMQAIYTRYLPNKVLLLADGGAAQSRLAESLPLIDALGRESGRATA